MLLNQDLPNGHIDCMIDDRNGNTWLGTNSGIITINNKITLSTYMLFRKTTIRFAG